MEEHVAVDIHTAACGGPHAGAVGYALKEAASCGKPMEEQPSGRSCGLRKGALAGTGFLAGTVASQVTHARASSPEGL